MRSYTDSWQRRFGFWSMLGFTCTILVTWEGSLMYDLTKRSRSEQQLTIASVFTYGLTKLVLPITYHDFKLLILVQRRLGGPCVWVLVRLGWGARYFHNNGRACFDVSTFYKILCNAKVWADLQEGLPRQVANITGLSCSHQCKSESSRVIS